MKDVLVFNIQPHLYSPPTHFSQPYGFRATKSMVSTVETTHSIYAL